MSAKKEYKITSFEELKDRFPKYQTAIVYKAVKVSRYEISMRHRALKASQGSHPPIRTVNGQIPADCWEQPVNPNAVDLIELRGSIILTDGEPKDVGNDTGPIYINHSYRPDLEFLEDFNQNDLITILYGKYGKQAVPRFIYNHETRTMVDCQHDLTRHSWDDMKLGKVQTFWQSAKDCDFAGSAFIFLNDNGKLPPAQNPRPMTNDFIAWKHAAPFKWNCTSCGCAFFSFLIIGGFIWISILAELSSK